MAAHHIQQPRPAEAAATVPDDATHAYAVTELRRVAYWSLDKHPALLDALTAEPTDPGLRLHATQILAADLNQYPHLVGPVAAFVGRAWAGPLPPSPPPPKRFHLGRLRFGPAVLVGIIAVVVVVVLAAGATGAVLLRRPPPPAEQVRFQGSIEFGAVDLDQQPPGPGPGMDVAGVAGPGFQLTGNAVGALYQGSSPPTKATCSKEIAQNGVGGGDTSSNLVLDEVITGMQFCVGTRAGHVVHLRVTGTTSSTFTATVTVWGP